MKRMRREPIDDMMERMQNLFEDFQEAGREITGFGNIPIDIQDEGDRYVVKADLPGLEKDEIDLRADEKSLEIMAESNHEVKEENEKYVKRERQSRSFRRTVRWPQKIDPESIEAEFEEGVLSIHADKEESTGRDIEIQ